jgi:hypothetical protein
VRELADDIVSSAAIYGPVRWFAQITSTSEKSTYRLAKNDPTFPALWIGGSLRIHKERALKWLRDREQGRRRLRVVKGGEASA